MGPCVGATEAAALGGEEPHTVHVCVWQVWERGEIEEGEEGESVVKEGRGEEKRQSECLGRLLVAMASGRLSG